jgi:hypothetical protein
MDDGILLVKYGVNNVHLCDDIHVIQHDWPRGRIVKAGGYELQLNRHGNILIIFFIIFQNFFMYCNLDCESTSAHVAQW